MSDSAGWAVLAILCAPLLVLVCEVTLTLGETVYRGLRSWTRRRREGRR